MRATIVFVCLLGAALLAACNSNQPWSINQNGSGMTSQTNAGGELSAGPTVQGSGRVSTDKRSLEPFNHLAIALPAEVEVRFSKGDSGVSITFDDNLLPLIKTSIDGETLKIRSEKQFNSHETAKIILTTPHLQAVDVAGYATVNVPNLKESAFNVAVSGASNLTGNGTCDELSVRLSGAGNVKLADVQSQSSSVFISGAGNVEVGPSDSMEVTISGTGNVRYKGNPKIDQHISGIGTITQI